MTDLPPVICDYLCRRSLAHRHPAFLRLDQAGNVCDGGGDLAFHSLTPLAVGQPVSAILDFMEGLLPLDDDTCHLGCLQPQADACIDVHIIPERQDHWILLLDTRAEERQRRAMQQKANELALVRESQAQAPEPKASAAGLEMPGVNFAPRGDRCLVAVLAAELRLTAGAEEKASPVDLIHRLTAMQRRMVAGVQADAGLVHSQAGDTLVAIFGLLPAHGGPSEQAIAAAIKLQRRSGRTDGFGPSADCLPSPAVVVTTGTAIVALETAATTVHLLAMGPPLQAASQLLPTALPGRILTDANSFGAAGPLQAHFEPFKADRESPARSSHLDLRITRP
ncbi:MAG: hypothetical protein PVF97_01645 [Desulfobacterales bacterium]|jgi:class 3 adenylate cyclase